MFCNEQNVLLAQSFDKFIVSWDAHMLETSETYVHIFSDLKIYVSGFIPTS